MFWNCIKRSYKLIIQQLFLKEKSIDLCQHSDKYLEFNIYENNQLDIYYESSKDSYEKSVPLDSKIMIQEINKFYNEL